MSTITTRFLLVLSFLISPVAWADVGGGGVKSITEEDASPTCFPWQAKFPNGSVTDNGDGTCSVNPAAGSGAPTDAEYVVTEANGTLSAEVSPSAANQVPNSTSSSAGSWTDSPTIKDLLLTGSGPDLGFQHTGGDLYGFHTEANNFLFKNTTDSVEFFLVDGANHLFLKKVLLENILAQHYSAFCGGPLSTSMSCEEARIYIKASCTPKRLELAVTIAPTGQAVIVDVNECSPPTTCTTLFSNQANRPTIAAGDIKGNTLTFNDTQLAAGSYLGIDMDQIGNTVSGSNLTATLVCETAASY